MPVKPRVSGAPPLLGALSVAGWLIGLLVGGLTVVLSRVLRPRSRST
jgi:hypothetical protein